MWTERIVVTIGVLALAGSAYAQTAPAELAAAANISFVLADDPGKLTS